MSLLKLPFAQHSRLEAFIEVREAPLVARRGAPARTGAPVVMLAMRGLAAPEALRRAARECPEFEFWHVKPELTLDEPNVKFVSGAFADLVASSTVVVSKLGYGTAAECVLHRKPLLYPPREGFREDAITRVEAARYTRLCEIPVEEFQSGNWAGRLRRLAALAPPSEILAADGAQRCAEFLAAA
jgi:hypothetical protein